MIKRKQRLVSRLEIIAARQSLSRAGLKPALSVAAPPLKTRHKFAFRQEKPLWEKAGQSFASARKPWITLKRGVEFTSMYETPVNVVRTCYWKGK